MANLIRRGMEYVKLNGVEYTLRRCGEKAGERLFRFYDHTWRQLAPTPEELAAQRAAPIEVGLISVVVPVYNTNPDMLREMACSLLAQTYGHWEAVLYDDHSPDQSTADTLADIATMDERFRTFRGEQNQGISGSSNSAIALAQGEWIALLDHDDLLTPDALYTVAQTILTHQPDLIYSDEDKVTENGKHHTDPHFKPDFCPDDLRSGNYICHLMVMRKSLLEKAGGFRTAFNGSQDHDLTLRCVEQTDKIVHIPKILYHWRTVGGSVSHQNLMKCVDAACCAVEEHMARIGWPGTARPCNGNIRLHYDIQGEPTVGAYIFGTDEADCQPCAATLQKSSWPKLTVHTVPVAGGHYAAMNRAAATAMEDVLLFLDASVQVLEPEFVTELLMYAQRDDVGAVTPKLIDRRRLITHGGFAVGMQGMAQCRQPGLPSHVGGWHLMMQKSQNVAAVSAACLMVRRDHWIPFDEDYQGGLGAVDWSLRLMEKGMRHVFTPHAQGKCENRELLLLGKRRNAQDAVRYAERWKNVKDPCYSSLLNREKGNYRLRRDYRNGNEQARCY